MDHGRGARGRRGVWRWAVNADVVASNRDRLADTRRRAGVHQNGHELGPKRLRRYRGRSHRNLVIGRIAGAHRPPLSSGRRNVDDVVRRVRMCRRAVVVFGVIVFGVVVNVRARQSRRDHGGRQEDRENPRPEHAVESTRPNSAPSMTTASSGATLWLPGDAYGSSGGSGSTSFDAAARGLGRPLSLGPLRAPSQQSSPGARRRWARPGSGTPSRARPRGIHAAHRERSAPGSAPGGRGAAR
jgi:hypothetical protein